MKALRLLCVLLFVVCLLPAAAEEASWTVEAAYTARGNQQAESGTLIPASDYGKVIRLDSEVGGWVRIIAPCDGELKITVLCPDIDRDSFQLSIRSDSRPKAVWPRFERSAIPQTYTFPDVKGGEGVYWWAHMGNGWTYTDDFLMVVCFTGHHANGDGMPRSVAATCTEPALDISEGCVYCGVTVTESGPALGHDWSTEEITQPSTCAEEGGRSHSCLRCGEVEFLCRYPLLDHQAGEPIIIKASSCTDHGESEVRCTLCDAFLYAIPLPLADHAAARTNTDAAPLFTYETTHCSCGYILSVDNIAECSHPHAVSEGKRDGELYTGFPKWCPDCHIFFRSKLQPTGIALVSVILTCMCALLLAAAAVLVVAIVLTAFLPMRRKKKPAADPSEGGNQ